MRNWNAEAVANFFEEGKVLSLPMRNWNRNLPALKFGANFRSQPTYEELKRYLPLQRSDLRFVLSLPMRNWNLIKVWRMSKPGWFSAYLWGIETHHVPRSAGTVKVLSLPMRNWNPIGDGPGSLLSLRFSAYLWGIETYNRDADRQNDALFSAYLWGIETCNGHEQRLSPYTVLSLPMRNWNF